MDYEKAYKEALERAKVINPGTANYNIVTCIFPELKESKDEKMINFISQELVCLRATDEKGSDRYNELTKAIAWLEKQNEQKPSWSEEDIDMIQDAIHWIQEFQQSDKCKDENDMQNSVTCENWLKSLKDKMQPNHWEPRKEQMEALKFVVNYFGELTEHFAEYDGIKSLYNDLKNL